MLRMDKLADRLTWQRNATGIEVVIPARLSWRALFFAAWLAMWTLAGKSAFHRAFPTGNNSRIDPFDALWLVGWALGEAFVSATIIWALGGRTLVRLGPAQLEIERDIFGIRLNKRSFVTHEIRNLRFSPPTSRGRSSNPSHISFEFADKTIEFGSDISDAEALALIGKMLEVYAFPKERAFEYLDLSP
jgi:hypothetical protein